MNKKILKLLKKKNKIPIVCLTAYSKSIAKILDNICDVVLVGDSLAHVLYGMKNTHNINLDTMIKHAKSVGSGTKKSLVVVDMPINTYKNKKMALKNAKQIMKFSKCDAVKIENNGKNYNIIHELTMSKIPVMGHIGFTPQFKKKFKKEGINSYQEKKLIKEAKKIETEGAFSIVLECISSKVAKKITKSLKIPTIGIGSSAHCDSQILVTDDMLGLSGFYPKFVKKYVNLNKIIEKGIQKYKKEVIKKIFPKKINSY